MTSGVQEHFRFLCSSPDVLAEKYGIRKQLKVSLTRTPVPGSAPTALSLSSQVQNQVAHRQTNCSTISEAHKGLSNRLFFHHMPFHILDCFSSVTHCLFPGYFSGR